VDATPSADAGDADAMLADGVLSIRAACAFLSLSMAKVYRLAQAGELRLMKLGSRTVIPKRSAIAFLRRALDSYTGAAVRSQTARALAARHRGKRKEPGGTRTP
jgi:excisionase family DNA binding protein